MTIPFFKMQFRFASVYGNHDVGPNVTRQEILAAEQKYFPLCYTQEGPYLSRFGVTNYNLKVYPPLNASQPDKTNDIAEEEEKPALILWFFDSQGGKDEHGEIPAVVDEYIVAWFR